MDQREMPKYQSYKKVWALKIAKLEPMLNGSITSPEDEHDGTMLMTPEEEGYGQIVLDADYVRKHNPQSGGYYVVYEDGYKSWSPANAFEEGYKLISSK